MEEWVVLEDGGNPLRFTLNFEEMTYIPQLTFPKNQVEERTAHNLSWLTNSSTIIFLLKSKNLKCLKLEWFFLYSTDLLEQKMFENFPLEESMTEQWKP